MAKKLYEEASVQSIADAIREKDYEDTAYKIGEMAAAITAIPGSPIVDNSLENTVQYRQMNATAAAFLANVDYTENAGDYSVTKVTPYYSATTAYSKEEPDGLKIKVPANTALTVAQGGKTRSDAVSGAGVIYNMEPLKAALKERVWQWGSMKEPQWLVQSLCGGKFDPHYFTRYLKEKYTALYQL